MSGTYRDVDAAGDVDGAVDWQERVDAWPAIAAYKRRVDELCQDHQPVLDVGAGPGLDAQRTGALVVDRSRAMARRGRRHGVAYVLGDAMQLPVATASVGAVRCDRTVQHLDDPAAAVDELARCIRPGGRLVIADPDQQTLTISVPGAPPELVARIRRRRRDVGYRNGTYVSALPARLAERGCTDITVDAFPLVLRDPDDAFGIATWAHHWRFAADDASRWSQAVEASRDGGFLYAVTYFVVSASVASPRASPAPGQARSASPPR